MIPEKLKFLQQTGRIHFFNIGDSNFLYSRENNQTYQINGEIYSGLKGDIQSSETLEAVSDFFELLKRDIKPTANYYTLYILDGEKFDLHFSKLKERCFIYTHSEIVFDESNEKWSEVSAAEIKSLLGGIGPNDLTIVEEKKISTSDLIDGKHIGDDNTTTKIFWDVNLATQDNFPNLDQLIGRLKFEYSSSRESDTNKLINSNHSYLCFYTKSNNEIQPFIRFLIGIIDGEPLINKKIYNIYSLANFLVSDVHFGRTIETFNDNTFNNANNETCDNCWARHACWITKSFQLLNINLFEIDKYSEECNSIRKLVEHIIVKLRTIEHNNRIAKENETYNFDGVEIKLIN